MVSKSLRPQHKGPSPQGALLLQAVGENGADPSSCSPGLVEAPRGPGAVWVPPYSALEFPEALQQEYPTPLSKGRMSAYDTHLCTPRARPASAGWKSPAAGVAVNQPGSWRPSLSETERKRDRLKLVLWSSRMICGHFSISISLFHM